ncbi:3-hydroxyisobutyrate dehydrogenase [Pseudomonas sp. A46]|nr:L-threonate dehydrogenase [Pseudomonas sp. A46]OWJ90827.1 3-hydroxyisobutyrate dehydrogenase [Pseudomonas sp. A46]
MTEAFRYCGVIGLGSIGMGIARSLLRAGIPVWGYDRCPRLTRDFAEESHREVADAVERARRTEVLILAVVDAAQVEDVLFGNGALADALPADSVVVVCSTIAASAARRIAARLDEHQLLMLDAPTSGGALRAASGDLTLMASGSEAAFQRAEAALAAMATRLFKLGTEVGQGSQVKLVNQLLAGVHVAAAAEAMAYGIRQGCDPEQLFEVIRHSAGNSWMFEDRVPHLLAGDYRPRSAVDIFVKDLRLVLDSTREAAFPLPLAASAYQLFEQASAAGLGREDDIAVAKLFPGIELPQTTLED